MTPNMKERRRLTGLKDPPMSGEPSVDVGGVSFVVSPLTPRPSRREIPRQGEWVWVVVCPNTPTESETSFYFHMVDSFSTL